MGKRLDDSLIVTSEVPVALIDPHPNNPNQHPEAQLKQLAASHHEFGQYKRVLLWARPDGRYIQVTGHGFQQGAIRDGRTTIRAEILPEDTDPSVVEAILVADNQHSKNSKTDDDVLARLLKGQANQAKNLSALGFTQETANTLFLRVTNSHATDFLQEILQPTPSSFAQPSQPSSLSQVPLGPTYEETLAAEGYTPTSLQASLHQKYEQEEKGLPASFASLPLSQEKPVVESEEKQWFPVTYTVTQEQRATLLEAIKKAKQQWMLETSADAIVAICAQFIGHV